MPVVGNAYQGDTQNVMGEGIGSLLNLVLTGATKMRQGGQDKAYRSAAAKLMGVPEEDLGYFQRDELKDLVKERYKSNQEIEKEKAKPKEWKPATQEEAIAFEKAKAGAKGDLFSTQAKEKEAEIRMKIANKQPITKSEKAFYEANTMNKFIPNGVPIIDDTVPAPGAQGSGGGIGEVLKNILGGISQAGNNMNPAAGFINMIRPQQGAQTAPVPTEVAKDLPQPGASAPDPVAARIKQAIDGGMDPQEVKRQLIEKGVDPTIYGL